MIELPNLLLYFSITVFLAIVGLFYVLYFYVKGSKPAFYITLLVFFSVIMLYNDVIVAKQKDVNDQIAITNIQYYVVHLDEWNFDNYDAAKNYLEDESKYFMIYDEKTKNDMHKRALDSLIHYYEHRERLKEDR